MGCGPEEDGSEELAHDLAQRRHLGNLELPLEVVESELHVALGLVPDDLAGPS